MDYTRRDLLALMGTAGALGRYGDAAAQDAAANAALPLAAIVERNDAAVRAALQSQIADPASPNRGSVPDQFGLHSAGSASGVVETLAASFVHPRSAFHRTTVLLERIRIAARFLERAQSPQGNIDLLTTNFNSPPDTGFVVHNVATAAAIGRLHGAEDIATVLRPFLVRAGAGMAEGGVHTPNHRWVICSALAQINDLFPDERYVRRIDEWLAEGIDIDGDGQFTERSTLTYNVVTDRALLVMAAKLKRPELLEPVRREPAQPLVSAPRRWRGRHRDLTPAGSIHTGWHQRLLVSADLPCADRRRTPSSQPWRNAPWAAHACRPCSSIRNCRNRSRPELPFPPTSNGPSTRSASRASAGGR